MLRLFGSTPARCVLRTTAATTAAPTTTTTTKSIIRTGSPSLLLRRTMATDQAQKCEWLIILPDQEGALGRRMEVRSQHLANMSSYPPDFWLWGGGFLSEPPKEGEPMKMLGSAMLAWAGSKEEVLAKLKEDVYSKNEVWDWEKVQIYPFKSAIRKPL